MKGYSRKLMILAIANSYGYDINHMSPDDFMACENLWCDDEQPRKDKKSFLDELDEMDPVARVLRVSRAKFLHLQEFKDKKSDAFLQMRENWWNHLRNAMQKYRISKETLAENGIDFRECKRFYFQAV